MTQIIKVIDESDAGLSFLFLEFEYLGNININKTTSIKLNFEK